jgi:hypothetical protein
MHVEDSSGADSPSDDEEGSPLRTKQKKKTKAGDDSSGSDTGVTIKGCPVPRPQLVALYKQYANGQPDAVVFDQLTDELLEYDATPALVAKWLTKAGLLVTGAGDTTGGKKKKEKKKRSSSQHAIPASQRMSQQQGRAAAAGGGGGGGPAAAAAAAAAAGPGNVVHVPEPQPLQVLGYLAALHHEHEASGE